MNPASETDLGCAGPAGRNTLRVDAARQLILDSFRPVGGWEMVPVRDALGRILARDVIAPCNVPAHDNSAMDGYAIRAADLAAQGDTTLDVVGTAFAGRAFSGIVGAGQAVRIMTGAVMPHGADAVVVQEITRSEGNKVVIPPGQRAGQNLRRAGEALALGSAALAAGEVNDRNRYTLYGALTRHGYELLDMVDVPDEPPTMEAAFAQAARHADVILTTGGVSVGEADFIRELMDKLGEVRFWKLEIKPGRPMAFGHLGGAWLFGLPGNPVAVMVTFYQIVQDALLRMAGMDPLPPRPLLEVVCADRLRKNPGRREYPRGKLEFADGRWQVRTTGAQGSGILRSMSEADCFIILDEECAGVEAGERVTVQLFEGLI